MDAGLPGKLCLPHWFSTPAARGNHLQGFNANACPHPRDCDLMGLGLWEFVKLLGDSHVPTRLTATGLERPGDIPRGQLLSRT